MKKRIIKFLKITISIIVILNIVLITSLYLFQEKLIFVPQKLEKNYQYNFKDNFKEFTIKTSDNKLLNALLFKADSTKGVIFYLHGNAGSLKSWGYVAKCYTKLNYDVFILDYRGFGKSEGHINGEQQLFEDNQIAYDMIKKRYDEKNIIILGYSIGTGLAAKLASENNPKKLILQAPYYSFEDLVSNQYHFPAFILKYKILTNKFLTNCKCPIVIFHGDEDNIINYDSSVKLKKELGDKVQLIRLNGQSHNGITNNEDYKKEIKKILNNPMKN